MIKKLMISSYIQGLAIYFTILKIMEHSINIKEAERIIRNGFGDELLKVACSCIAPFYWYCVEPDGTRKINNGTVFFLDTGNSRFAVTAYHVYKGFVDTLSKNKNTKCQISNLEIKLNNRIIGFSPELDLLTFSISDSEIKKIGKIFLQRNQTAWPPNPPEQGKGVFFAGYQGEEKTFSPFLSNKLGNF